MKNLIKVISLTISTLLITISTRASLQGADCQTISFDSSQFDELWGCPDTAIDSDFVMIAIKGEKMGLVNSKGKLILPTIYDSVEPNSIEKFNKNVSPESIEFTYENSEISGTINGVGEVITPEHTSGNPVYGNLEVSEMDDGKIRLTHLITREKFTYDSIFAFIENNKLPVKSNDNWGMVNIDTMQVDIPIIYQELFIFYEGTAETKLDGNFGAIDENNNIVVPFIYKNLTHFSTLPQYSSPVAIATPYDQAYFLVINKNNEVIDKIPKPSTDAIINTYNKDFLAFKKDNGQSGLLDWQGNIIYEAEDNYEVAFIDEGSIHLMLLSDEPENIEGGVIGNKRLSYQYDKQQGKLTLTEIP